MSVSTVPAGSSRAGARPVRAAADSVRRRQVNGVGCPVAALVEAVRGSSSVGVTAAPYGNRLKKVFPRQSVKPCRGPPRWVPNPSRRRDSVSGSSWPGPAGKVRRWACGGFPRTREGRVSNRFLSGSVEPEARLGGAARRPHRDSRSSVRRGNHWRTELVFGQTRRLRGIKRNSGIRRAGSQINAARQTNRLPLFLVIMRRKSSHQIIGGGRMSIIDQRLHP